ncbi:MAG: DUF6600 domain-containing protein [Caldimonas sp.]
MKTSNQRAGAETSTRTGWGRLDAMLVLAAFLGLAVLPAKAQTVNGGDPPSRAARLGNVDGQVWIYNDEVAEWQTVGRNRPLTTGDRIATDTGARAEITLGTTTLRLDAATEIEVAQLDDRRFVVRLAAGSIAARLRSPQALAEFEIDTDEGHFRVQTVGRYRFDRFEQTSEVTVYSGQAAYEAQSTALPVYTGQHAQFWIDPAGAPQYAMVTPARDAFTAWNDERDRSEDRAVATGNRFVSPEMTGAEDLVRYGQWQQTPDYGPIWIPTAVPVGWAPYSAGHWAFVRPWGWTWVDDAPWGFAPFHYGRWVYHRDAWCWAPGTYVARPVYAPALVAWVGGPRVALSISVGRGGPPVGWFPLAPREVYVPSYRASPRYVREVNITNVTNVTQITTIVNNRNGEADRRDFANRRLPHAVTFVPSDVMTRREPVGPAAARFRNDPQWRALVSESRPGPVSTAPPVTAPLAPPRPPADARVPRPPFEGRGAGGFAGRPEIGRPGDRQRTQPAPVGPVTSPPPVGAPSTVVGPVASPPPVGAPQAPALREDRAGRGRPPPPVGAPAPSRPVTPADETPHRMKIPTPVGRTQGEEPARVVPGLRGREGGVAEPRPGATPPVVPQAAPPSVVPVPPGANAPHPQERPGRRPERGVPAPQADPARAAEAARPAPPVAEPRPAEAARPQPREPRMNRPEGPRPRDEPRDEKGERR